MSNLTYVAPFFIVTHIKPSVTFYVDRLGFQLLYMGPDDDPFFAMVYRDNVHIMLKAIAPDIKPVPNRTRHEWARWDAYISTADPDALYEEYRTRGVVFHLPLRINDDGLLGFELMDADGYLLFFGRPNK
ncbi:MAG TPA: VOC family protein [Puia sp.]|jgi:catechol 2,3-dioxygenase-like lactoylglutathione lyase family enzyme|nr:VOC family protein [Puia sp.]